MNEPITTGDAPQDFQVTVTLPNRFVADVFRTWINSNEGQRSFWEWLSRNGSQI